MEMNYFNKNTAPPPIRPKRLETEFFCQTCDVYMTSQVTMDTHLVGQKHKSLVKRLKKEQNLLGTSSSERTQNFYPGIIKKDDGFYCELCDCVCSSISNVETHVVGIRHMQSVAFEQSFRTPAPTVVSRLEKLSKKHTGIVGLNFVVEYYHKDGEETCYYYSCRPCVFKCGEDRIMSHLLSSKHKLNVLREYSEKEYKNLMRSYGSSSKLSVWADTWATEIEKMNGRGFPQVKPLPSGMGSSHFSVKRETPSPMSQASTSHARSIPEYNIDMSTEPSLPEARITRPPSQEKNVLPKELNSLQKEKIEDFQSFRPPSIPASVPPPKTPPLPPPPANVTVVPMDVDKNLKDAQTETDDIKPDLAKECLMLMDNFKVQSDVSKQMLSQLLEHLIQIYLECSLKGVPPKLKKRVIQLSLQKRKNNIEKGKHSFVAPPTNSDQGADHPMEKSSAGGEDGEVDQKPSIHLLKVTEMWNSLKGAASKG